LLKERKEILHSFHVVLAPPQTGELFTREPHSGSNATLIGFHGENL